MSRKKIKKAQKRILTGETEKKCIITKLLQINMMLRGSYALVYTKCGKENCRCNKNKGHPHSRITWSEKGQAVTRKVPPEYIPWVQEATYNYRQFRSLRRKLFSLQGETKNLLDVLENELIEKTRSGRIFLMIKPQNRRKTSRSVPKKRNRKKRRAT